MDLTNNSDGTISLTLNKHEAVILVNALNECLPIDPDDVNTQGDLRREIGTPFPWEWDDITLAEKMHDALGDALEI
jgi:hypothetical protein